MARLSELMEASGGGLVPVGPVEADPDVTSVVTTDLLDPRRYLAGGELVLTGLAWWRPNRPARSRDFVAALLGAGVAALAAGEAQLNGVPDDLVAACAAADVPLLSVPVEVSFAEIIERTNRLLSPPRPDDLAAVLGRHRALLAAATGEAGHLATSASGAARTAGLGAVLDWVGSALGVRCSVLAATGRLIGSTDPAPDESERRDFARCFLRAERLPHPLVRPGRRSVTLFGAGPTSVRAACWVVAVDGDHRDWDGGRRGVVEELVSLVALDRDLSQRRSDVEHQLASAIGRASAAETVAVMSWCGLDAGRPSVAVVGIGQHAGAVLAEGLAAVTAPRALAEGDGGWLGMVATTDPADLVNRLRHVVGLLEPALGAQPLRIGVSDAVTGGDGVLGAVAEARAVALCGDPSRPHSVAGPDLLSSHALLIAAVPAQLRQSYRQRVLGPLLEHDRAHRTDLVATLSAYLECSASWSRCAAKMHVHVNTLRYRIGRIEALTGRDLRRLEDQVDLLFALHLPG